MSTKDSHSSYLYLYTPREIKWLFFFLEGDLIDTIFWWSGDGWLSFRLFYLFNQRFRFKKKSHRVRIWEQKRGGNKNAINQDWKIRYILSVRLGRYSSPDSCWQPIPFPSAHFAHIYTEDSNNNRVTSHPALWHFRAYGGGVKVFFWLFRWPFLDKKCDPEKWAVLFGLVFPAALIQRPKRINNQNGWKPVCLSRRTRDETCQQFLPENVIRWYCLLSRVGLEFLGGRGARIQIPWIRSSQLSFCCVDFWTCIWQIQSDMEEKESAE